MRVGDVVSDSSQPVVDCIINKEVMMMISEYKCGENTPLTCRHLMIQCYVHANDVAPALTFSANAMAVLNLMIQFYVPAND